MKVLSGVRKYGRVRGVLRKTHSSGEIEEETKKKWRWGERRGKSLRRKDKKK